jgi:hypothetical protein
MKYKRYQRETLNRPMGRRVNGSDLLGDSLFRNSELATNASRRVIVDLPVSWNGSLLLFAWVRPYRVAATLSQQFTTLLTQMLHKILSLHEATSPAGTCSTALLAAKWR